MTSVIQTCQKAITSAAPMALWAAIATSSTDNRVKNISLCLGCMGTGLALIRQSGATQSLKSWTWKEEAPSSNWTMAGAGALLMIFGTYQFATGFVSPTVQEPVHMPMLSDTCPLPEPFQQEFTPMEEPFSEPESCEEAIEQAKSIFLRYPDARKLWEEVEEEGPFKVRCGTSQEAPYGDVCISATREIVIEDGLRDNLSGLGSTLFELNNLRSTKAFELARLNPCVAYTEAQREKFVRDIEQVEYDNVKRACEITRNCVDQGCWPEGYGITAEGFNLDSFSDYLRVQEESGHSNAYRRQWHYTFNPTYEW